MRKRLPSNQAASNSPGTGGASRRIDTKTSSGAGRDEVWKHPNQIISASDRAFGLGAGTFGM
jgi:hypothetical protein